MQELIEHFTSQGLTVEQAQNSIQTIHTWLQENYPVAGAVLASWIKSELSRG